MKVQMQLVNRVFSAVVVLGLSLFIVSCGGKKEEAPAAPPAGAVPTTGAPAAPTTQSAPAPAPAAGLSGFIEDKSPGTDINPNDYAQRQTLDQRFRDNVRFYGNVTVASITAIDYTVTNPGYPNVTFARSNPQNLPNQTPTLQMQASGNVILVQSPYNGTQRFYFQYEFPLYGQVLKSTDVVGLYISEDWSSLLKVQYNVKNPPMQLFQVNNYGGYGNTIQIRVTSKPINTGGVTIPAY